MGITEKYYRKLRKQADIDYSGKDMAKLLCVITISSADYIFSNCIISKLNSLVDNKEYFCFENQSGKISRPLNIDLFENSLEKIKDICKIFIDFSLEQYSQFNLSKLLYTIGMCFPSYIDIVKQNDKKTPGTFFEYLIGHIFARRFKTNPRKKLEIPVVNKESPKHLPTDLIFDLYDREYGLHVPIKSTTRERVIQVWAHQRILDSVYGVGRFRGILVVASETKLDSKKREVIEICLPSQWRIYQLHIAELKRIYYLDPPQVYLDLNNIFPNIPVKSFSTFFQESITSL